MHRMGLWSWPVWPPLEKSQVLEGPIFRWKPKNWGTSGSSTSPLLGTDGPGGGKVVIRGGNLMMVDSKISSNVSGPTHAIVDNGNVDGIDIELSGRAVLDPFSVIESIVTEKCSSRSRVR